MNMGDQAARTGKGGKKLATPIVYQYSPIGKVIYGRE
jgi:hypothetical protein